MSRTLNSQNESRPGRLRCAVFLDELPGTQFKGVRKPPSGLLGWLSRTQGKLVRKLVPSEQFPFQIRGARVAIDYLIYAFLKHGQYGQLSFVVPSFRRDEFQEWVSGYRQQGSTPPVEIHLTSHLRGGGLDIIAPDVWLNLYGDIPFSLALRDELSSRVYPTVTVQHGLSAHSSLYERFLRSLSTPSYACDSLVCTSLACKKALANIFNEISNSFSEEFGAQLGFQGRFDVIPLCVDTDALRPKEKPAVRKELGIPREAMVMLYIGYLSPVKADLAPLLPMIRRLVCQNPTVQLLFMVAGTGPESYCKGLGDLIEEHELARTVILLREVSDLQKEQLLGAADIFVAPCDSMQESFGLTPVEAMAFGLPQVVADWNGYRETVLNGETGYLVPTCWGRCDGEFRFTGPLFGPGYDHTLLSQSVCLDVPYMEERIQALIRNPQLRAAMSERSRARAVTEFSLLNVTRRYEELWNELTGIARKLRPRPKRQRFDQPAYFNFFGHFATAQLTDDSVIRKVDTQPAPLGKLIRILEAEFPGISLFDEQLLTQILKIVSGAGNGPESMRVGQLVSLLANESRSPDGVRRHILFLLKHGRVAI